MGKNDLLNCEGDIDQINNILRNIKHMVYKCRQYGGPTRVFLSGLTLTNRLPGQLIKDLKILIFRFVIYAAEHQIVIVWIMQT